MSNKRNRPPLVDTESVARIQAFATDLKMLCERYGVDINGTSHGGITLYDQRRTTPMPDGYEYDADFEGCDARGIYSTSYNTEGDLLKEYVPIHIEDLLPEDWYVEGKGRGSGR